MLNLKSIFFFFISFYSCIQAQQKPNIIFVLVDDLGYADVGFNGSKFYETPNLDKLAKNSLVVNNAYMYPTCSPSRTGIFTGQQSFRTGVYNVPVLEHGTAEENIFSRWTVTKDHEIYAEPLAKNGYKSIHLGKYHIVGPYPNKELSLAYPFQEKLSQPKPGDYSWLAEHKTKEVLQFYPQGRGFIENVGGTYKGDPAFEMGGYKSYKGGYRAPFSNPFVSNKPTDEWLSDRFADEAIRFIGEHKNEPFFVNLDFYAVHQPTKSRNDELYKKYSSKPGDSITGQGLGKQREQMASYATMIESVDDNIQKIIDYLEKENLRENTLIIVTSDNGFNGGQSHNNLLRGYKRQIYEGGIRVPLLINWPNKIKARRTDVAVSLLDFFPTFLEVANIQYSAQILDGNSLVPLFKKDTKTLEKRPLFWHLASNNKKQKACSVIRKNNYKLIQYLATGKLELYNLKKDPKESDNLVEKETKTTQKMLAELLEWRKSNKVPLPPNSILRN
ncbi:arylsulfatase A-like enzyme [Wenyingzhuangia heitensis]|uniref:Arylsulfatase A-like enzyme n=1 Tax=Wenyingzhuangia heitensis TaxID=1487859 RepID=A0ABX0U7L3_9FLAO|nr:sulfatase [Wenyingzhuangia heitensis]NIJ44835.1 arylsulfatase A-like enzyme [Wenyingzhuangia heitensis]